MTELDQSKARPDVDPLRFTAAQFALQYANTAAAAGVANKEGLGVDVPGMAQDFYDFFYGRWEAEVTVTAKEDNVIYTNFRKAQEDEIS